MVTLQRMGNRTEATLLEIVCKSTDIKPLNATGGIDGQNITNGSTLFQMDDCKAFMFDYDTDTWFEL